MYKKKPTPKQSFVDRLDFGLWAEQSLVPWIEKYFSNETRSISYWYNSEYEFKTKAGLTGNTLIKKLGEYDLKFGVYKKGDISADKTIRFEIKTDKYSEDTGNIIIKHRANGWLSGPFSTQAEYFIFFQPLFNKNNVYIIKSVKFVELLNQEKFRDYSQKMPSSPNIECFVIPKQLIDDDFISYGGRIETHIVDVPHKYNTTKINTGERVVYYGNNNPKTLENPLF
jgi:hypothetical protein